MSPKEIASPVLLEVVERCIYVIRGQRVMLDADLARLYGVETKTLNRAVRRNASRFPGDFMFQLTKPETEDLRCQIGTSSYGGRRYLPYAFTEQGVAMLSSVLNSERAVLVNIAVIRAFVRLRELLGSNRALAVKLAELERKIVGHDAAIQNLFDAIRTMLVAPQKPKRLIGFNREKEKS
jgi:hypothetical protein